MERDVLGAAAQNGAIGLLKSDKRFIRVIVAALLGAFTLIIALNSAQSFVEQHRVHTAEDFGILTRASSQIGTSSQRVALVNFAALNPPRPELREKLYTESDEELLRIREAAKLVASEILHDEIELAPTPTREFLLHLQKTSAQFIEVTKRVREAVLSHSGDKESIGIFADLASELLKESRKATDLLSKESVQSERRDRYLRREIFFASSAATILTAAIVLFFIVHRLRMELERRRKTEANLLRANEDLERFSAIVAHDLKSPLNNIALSVEMLSGDLAPESPKVLHEVILKETDRLRRMVEALLRLSRLRTKQVTIRPLNVQELIQQTKLSLKSKLDECGGTVLYDGVSIIKGDKELLQNLFQNLIENSIKYRSEAPPVVHIMGSLNRDGAHFIYDDNGLGIPAEKRLSVFDPFVQADTQQEGLGLGLSVVRKIVTAHGGSIEILEREGPGTRFIFSLPRSARA